MEKDYTQEKLEEETTLLIGMKQTTQHEKVQKKMSETETFTN